MIDLYNANFLPKINHFRLGLIIAVLFAIGCQNEVTTQPSYNAEFKNIQHNTISHLSGNWVLRDISETYTPADIDFNSIEQIPTLNIDLTKKHISGNSSCNNYMGTIEIVNDKKIRFSNVVSTRMACSDINIENNFLNALSKVKYYKFEQNHLLLLNDTGRLLLNFEKR